MLKLLDISKKYGDATHKYPFEPYVVADNFRGKPAYKFDLCIGCAACGIACPSNAITVQFNEDQSKLVWEFDCGRCIFCGRCDEVCPTAAITLSNEFELAVKFDKNALIQRGELETQYCSKCNKPFSAKRLVHYGYECLSKANLGEKRLKEAENYLTVCPTCKKTATATSFTRGEEMVIE
ncbi:formate hydrogenlyase complex iron-sulfur subunit [Sulfurospirillum arcachonense]|uniref:formate hydrogenlyase complex iron-sulfur subunit n=1 Tax=Sulfurospirillum arcachonense TaxID=57666 RepID=UPI00046A6AB4|nr:formate hydrogenlyase complex iron-sulfur subunit [Sulfurospirillum arcachonense]